MKNMLYFVVSNNIIKTNKFTEKASFFSSVIMLQNDLVGSVDLQTEQYCSCSLIFFALTQCCVVCVCLPP